MKNNLPIEVKKENVLKKIFKFFRNIFKKEIKAEINNKNNDNPSFQENLKNEKKITELYKVLTLENVSEENSKKAKKRKKIEEIIQIIEKEPKAIKKLDIPQLEVIDNYYKEKIAECKMKIAKLS